MTTNINSDRKICLVTEQSPHGIPVKAKFAFEDDGSLLLVQYHQGTFSPRSMTMVSTSYAPNRTTIVRLDQSDGLRTGASANAMVSPRRIIPARFTSPLTPTQGSLPILSTWRRLLTAIVRRISGSRGRSA